MKQKNLLKSLLLLCALIVGSVNVWAEDITYTLTISPSNFNTTSYAANNNEKTSDAVCTTDASKKFEVKWTSNQVMKNSDDMQWQKNKGYIYNSTNLGTIVSVDVTSSAGTFTTYYGTSEQPSSGTAGIGKGFFKTSVGSATGTTSSVVVTFKFTIPTITFNDGSVNVGSTLDLATLFSSDSDGDVTYTITSGDSYGSIDSDGHTLNGLATGSVTVKASQAADGIYAASEETATITVNSSTSPNAVLSTTTLDFGDVEVSQTKSLTFTITPANLTGDLTIACNNAKYTVSPATITQATTTETTITVTAAPTALADNMDGTITISGGGITTKEVTLSAAPYQVSTVTLVAADSKGTFKQGDDVVTSIVSRVGNKVTVKAIPVTGYVFSSWSATDATPASSTDAETEFTLNAAAVTLTANFVADPKLYATLEGTDIASMTGEDGYGNVKSITKDGLTWNTTGYKTKTADIFIQLRSTGSPYIQLPKFSGNIQSISFTVTNASADDKTGAAPSTTFTFAATKGGEAVKSASNSGNTLTIDLSGEASDYSTGFITSSAGARVWDITVAYIPTDFDVTITSAKYATFCDHLARNFSGTGITVYKAKVEGSAAKLTKVSDGIVPANTGVILYHAIADTYAVPVTTTGASLSDNELVGTTAETAVDYSAGGKFNYILQMDGANPVFRKATGNKIRANRAYLSTTYDVTIAGAPALDIIIEGENSDDVTTGIDTIEHSTLNIEYSEVYNLNGQRVAHPTKGLYIVNGRKVVIK